MKWYRVLERPDEAWESLDVDEVDFKGFDPARLYTGELIEDWPDDVVFFSSEDEPWERADDALLNVYMDLRTFQVYMFPIYSARLQTEIVTASIKDIQFLPCRVRDGKGVEVPGYSVANVLTVRSALDVTKSKLYYQDESLKPPNVLWNVKAIVTATLFADRVTGCHALRLPELPMMLFVSDKFRKAFKKIKGSGITFREVGLV